MRIIHGTDFTENAARVGNVAAALGKSIRIRVEPGLGRPDFRLIEIAAAEQADLIITGTHQWRGVECLWHVSTSHGLSGVSKALLGSVAQKVMAQSHRPVLVVREAQA